MALVRENRWSARPRTATVLKAVLYGAPLVVAAGAAHASQRLVVTNAPRLGWGGAVAVSFVVATACLVLGERLIRRALPLVMLLRLSLVFPDQVPSRLGVALRAASPRRLARLAATDGYDAQSAEHVLALVSALNAHDRRTRGHSERVRALTMMVADELEIVGEDREKLEWAALLHDIGKMSVPSEILNKPGRPDEDEWTVLQGHPAAGATYSSELHDWLGEWRHAIDQHHEKFDGSGYPLGIHGESIALGGRVVAVTDAFETMTATRSYKTPMSVEAARTELVRSSGSHFDPHVIRAFTNISLARIHGALGPVSWLTSLPFAGGVSGGVRIGSAIVGGAAAPVLAASIAAAATTATIPNAGSPVDFGASPPEERAEAGPSLSDPGPERWTEPSDPAGSETAGSGAGVAREAPSDPHVPPAAGPGPAPADEIPGTSDVEDGVDLLGLDIEPGGEVDDLVVGALATVGDATDGIGDIVEEVADPDDSLDEALAGDSDTLDADATAPEATEHLIDDGLDVGPEVGLDDGPDDGLDVGRERDRSGSLSG